MRLPAISALRLVLLAFATLASTACVYRMNIQQGNYLDPDAVAKLQTGMTRSQVRYLLGTPMLPDAFDTDRWDYLYYLRTGRLKKPDERRLTVFFAEDKVARIERVGVAESVPLPKEEEVLKEPDPVAPPAPVKPDATAPT